MIKLYVSRKEYGALNHWSVNYQRESAHALSLHQDPISPVNAHLPSLTNHDDLVRLHQLGQSVASRTDLAANHPSNLLRRRHLRKGLNRLDNFLLDEVLLALRRRARSDQLELMRGPRVDDPNFIGIVASLGSLSDFHRLDLEFDADSYSRQLVTKFS